MLDLYGPGKSIKASRAPAWFSTQEKKKGGVTAFGVEMPDGTFKPYAKQPCHAALGQGMGTGSIAFWTSLWHNWFVTKEERDAYFEYIFDPDHSPWRKLLKGVKLYRRTKSKELYAVRIVNNEHTTTTFLVNLCIASRIPLEHPYSLKLWYRLVQDGWPRHKALFAIHAFRAGVGNAILEMHSGHYFFSASLQPDLKALEAGEPHNTNPSEVKKPLFVDGGAYAGDVMIWTKGVIAKKDRYGYVSYTPSPYNNNSKLYNSLKEKREYKGMFKSSYTKLSIYYEPTGIVPYPIFKEKLAGIVKELE